MKDYIKYSSPTKTREFDFRLSTINVSILELANFLESNIGWTIVDYYNTSTYLVYTTGLPTYSDPFQPFIYKPYSAIYDDLEIGYYPPGMPAPSPNANPPYYTYWFPGYTSQLDCLNHTASMISLINPDFIGTPIYSSPYKILLTAATTKSKLLNGLVFGVSTAWGIGGSTSGGGYKLRSATYNGYYFEISLIYSAEHLYIEVYFGGATGKYMLGYYKYKIIMSPYQFIMHHITDPVIGDIAVNAKGLMVSLPAIEDRITSILSYCGFVKGPNYLGPVAEFGYPIGDINQVHDTTNIFIRINDTANNYATGFVGGDRGFSFAVFASIEDLLTESPTGQVPMIYPAYVCLPDDPSNINSQASIFGYLWNSLITSKYFPIGTKLDLDNMSWYAISNQSTAFLGQTPVTIFVAEEV